jgi:hypothetical protein
MTWRKAFTVSGEGDEAVKNFGSAGGNGSAGAAGGAIGLGNASGLGGVGAGYSGRLGKRNSRAEAEDDGERCRNQACNRIRRRSDALQDGFLLLGFLFWVAIWCSIHSIEADALRPVNCRSIAR